jgi:hypothetical protein
MKNSTQRANMNADTLKKQGTFFIQTIKSIVLIAGMLITTLGNHTFATLGNMHIADSNIIAEANSTSISDEIGNTKISTPSLRSFYRADREINRNMANEIKKLQFLRFELPSFEMADQNINGSFLNEYKIQYQYLNIQATDDLISNEFHAYNINYNIHYTLLSSDNEINMNFNNTYFISISDKNEMADASIDAQFHEENI